MQDQYRLLSRLGVKIVVASTDQEETAVTTVNDPNLSYSVDYVLSPTDIETFGAWPGERRGETIMEPAEFIFRPDSTVAALLYGTTQPGIVNPREIAGFVKRRL